MSGSAGMGFTPHIINIASGEVCDNDIIFWKWINFSVLVVYVIMIVGRVDEKERREKYAEWYYFVSSRL